QGGRGICPPDERLRQRDRDEPRGVVKRAVLLWRDACACVRGRARATRRPDRVRNGGDRLPAGGEGRGAEALPGTGRHRDVGGRAPRDPHDAHCRATRRRRARRPKAVVSAFETALARLRAVQARLDEHAAAGAPPGLTEPDPGGTERWEAGQVWAHLAEFPAYWLGQIQHILERRLAGDPEPVPFGRTKTDAARIAAIERDR